MKHQNIFWGGVLVFLGVLLLLSRMDVLVVNWWVLGKLWPVLLIFWGISILPVNATIKVVSTLVLAVVAVFIYVNMPKTPTKKNIQHHEKYEWGDEDSLQTNAQQLFIEPWEDGVDEAYLRLNAAAGSFRLGGTTGELIVGKSEGNYTDYSYKVERKGRKAEIVIREEGTRQFSGTRSGDFVIMLHPEPLWKFKFDVGAADVDFNFSEFRLSNLNIDAGASSIKLKLGDKEPETNININAGASSIKIEVPTTAGCMLTGNTVLSSRELEGFEKVARGKYRTPGFDEARQKIYIKVDAAVSSFEIRRVDI